MRQREGEGVGSVRSSRVCVCMCVCMERKVVHLSCTNADFLGAHLSHSCNKAHALMHAACGHDEVSRGPQAHSLFSFLSIVLSYTLSSKLSH